MLAPEREDSKRNVVHCSLIWCFDKDIVTLGKVNPDLSFGNMVDPDQLASDEAS